MTPGLRKVIQCNDHVLVHICYFKHISFRRKGLGVAYNTTMPSPGFVGHQIRHQDASKWAVSLVIVVVQFNNHQGFVWVCMG